MIAENGCPRNTVAVKQIGEVPYGVINRLVTANDVAREHDHIGLLRFDQTAHEKLVFRVEEHTVAVVRKMDVGEVEQSELLALFLDEHRGVLQGICFLSGENLIGGNARVVFGTYFGFVQGNIHRFFQICPFRKIASSNIAEKHGKHGNNARKKRNEF